MLGIKDNGLVVRSYPPPKYYRLSFATYTCPVCHMSKKNQSHPSTLALAQSGRAHEVLALFRHPSWLCLDIEHRPVRSLVRIQGVRPSGSNYFFEDVDYCRK